MFPHNECFRPFNIPTLRRNHRRRIASSNPSLKQPIRNFLAECPERPNFHQPRTTQAVLGLGQNSLNLEPWPKEGQKGRIDISTSIGNLDQNLLKSNELNCTESKLYNLNLFRQKLERIEVKVTNYLDEFRYNQDKIKAELRQNLDTNQMNLDKNQI